MLIRIFCVVHIQRKHTQSRSTGCVIFISFYCLFFYFYVCALLRCSLCGTVACPGVYCLISPLLQILYQENYIIMYHFDSDAATAYCLQSLLSQCPITTLFDYFLIITSRIEYLGWSLMCRRLQNEAYCSCANYPLVFLGVQSNFTEK